MKLSIYIFVIASILASTLGKTIIYVNYEFNIEEITAQFCENKNKPELKCNGKCHLKKQLRSQDEVPKGADKPTRISFHDQTFFFEKLPVYTSFSFLENNNQLESISSGSVSNGHRQITPKPPLA